MTDEYTIDDDSILKNYFNVHDHLGTHSIEQLKALTRGDRLPFAVCALNIAGNLNIGMMIRTACIMGAVRFIVFGRRAYDKRSCVGANNYIPVERVTGVINPREEDGGGLDATIFYETMHKFNYTPFFIETGGVSINTMTNRIDSLKDTIPCLIFGSESDGIPENILQNSPNVFSIPQLGVIRSLNVSSAASIAMWEMRKLYL